MIVWTLLYIWQWLPKCCFLLSVLSLVTLIGMCLSLNIYTYIIYKHDYTDYTSLLCINTYIIFDWSHHWYLKSFNRNLRSYDRCRMLQVGIADNAWCRLFAAGGYHYSFKTISRFGCSFCTKNGKIAASFHLRALAKTLRVALILGETLGLLRNWVTLRYTSWKDGTWTFAEWWLILYDMFSVASILMYFR